MKSRTIALVAALGAGIVLLTLAVLWRPGPPAPAGPATGSRVVVIAIDGLDGFLVSRYVREGRMPTVSRLLRRAATAEVRADRPVLPEVGWTMALRGRPLTESELEVVGTPGDHRLFSIGPEVARAVRDAGGRVAVVGWPCTWPVAEDDVPAAAPYLPESSSHATALAPALFVGGAGQATPDLSTALIEAVGRAEGSLDETFGSVFGPRPPDAAWVDDVAAGRWSVLADLASAELAARLIASDAPHLTLVYFGGLDAVCHRFLPAAMPGYFAAEPAGSERYADVVGNYHAFIDSAIERLTRLGDERTLFVLCSAYGTHPASGGASPTAAHDQGPPGIFILHGRTVPSIPVALQISTLDLAPTLLAALGVPIPSDMDGRVVAEVLPPGLLEQFPPAYRKPARREGAGSAPVPKQALADMERLASERLESLRADVLR